MSVMVGPSFAAWGAQHPGGFGGNITVVDKVPPDMLHLVGPHWYQFPPLDPLWHGIIGVVCIIMCVVAFIGNAMVLYIFTGTKALRTPSNLLVINLAFSDFCGIVCGAPIMIINCYYETWILGPFMCDMYGLAGGICGCGSIYTMTTIAMERYNVIVKGLSAKPLTTKGALCRIFIVWTLSTFWGIVPVLGWSRYVPEGNMSSCGTDYLNADWLSKSYILVYAVLAYFVPLITIIYSYWFIVKAVAAHEKSMREQAKKMNVTSLRSSEASQTNAECKLAKIALVTITLWFCAWTPYLITNAIGIFQLSTLSPLGTVWSALCAKASTVYNPIIYGISHPKYRQVLKLKFPSLVCGGVETTNDTQSTVSGVTNVNSTEEKETA
uniref:Long wavelength sensitive opsin 2 n=1 Tax=Byturus ochraceus TaxID=153018 RepID=A0A8F2SZE9_9CUCU|nr:long wavelength sensitive opsin 2 [Byturus ochraceus]